MKNSNVLKAFLIISGLIAVGIGAGLLFIPVSFEASVGVILSDDINLLSELRGTGGGLFASGILITLGAFVPKLTFTSTVISAVLYLAYGVARILAMAIDGIPSEGLIQTTGFEILIGLMGIYTFIKYREMS